MSGGPGGKTVGRISVKVLPDTSDFRRDLKRQLEAIRQTIKVGVELDSKGVSADLKALLAKLQAEAKDIHVGVDVDRNRIAGLDRDLAGLSRSLSGAGQSATEAGSGMGLIATKGIAIAALVAPAIGLVSALLAGLPALALAGAGAFAAVGLGLDGIKDAAKVLQPAIDGLKQSLSATFATELTPVFEKLAGVLPKFEGGLQHIARSLSGVVSGVVDFISSAQGMSAINEILTNTSKFFDQLAPVITTSVQAFTNLAAAGSRSFGYLTDMLGQFANGFNDMVTRVSSNGVLDSALRGLAQAIGPLLDLFNQLFEAGLKSMSTLGPALGNMFNGVGQLLVSLMPALTSLSGALGNVLGELGRQLAPVVEALTPAFTTLVDVIGKGLVEAFQILGPILTQVATIMNDTLLAFFEAVQPMLPQIADAFRQIGDALLRMFSDPKVVDSFVQLGTALGQLLVQLIPLLPPLTDLAIRVITSLADNLPKVVDFFTKLAQIAIPILKTAIAVIGPVISALSDEFDRQARAVGMVIDAIDGFIGWLQQLQAKVIEVFMDMGKAIGKWIQDTIQWFRELPGKLVSALGDLGHALWDAGVAMMKGFLDGLKSKFGDVKSFVGSIAKALIPLKGPLPYDRIIFVPAGMAMMEGLEGGLKTGFESVKQTVSGMGDELANSFDTKSLSDKWNKAAADAKLADVPKNFLEATGQGMLSDLGISESGAIGQLVKQVTNVNYQVTDFDEAQRAERRRQEKETKQYSTR